MAYRIILAFFLAVSVLFPSKIIAHEGHNHSSFITIVNPQRIAEYTKNPLESFKAEYKEIRDRQLPATWPITYDVLTNKEFVKELRNMDQDQEVGLFLEVSPKLSNDAGVLYNVSDSWHRATSLFLSGYTQKDREKLIDTYFETFKKEFGYYPKSVGAWWVDAYSLGYMQKKYGITSVLGMSDQYDLDGYSLWGTWWSVPFYPQKTNAALPAQTQNNKLDVVTLRWAHREPLRGYSSSNTGLIYAHTNNTSVTPSLFSLQDYATIGLPDSYFKTLLETYAIKKSYNEFGHAVIGLEGDLNPLDYGGYFTKRLDILMNMRASEGVEVLTMQEFANWYRATFPDLSPAHTISSPDLLSELSESSKQAIWHQTPFYRIGLTHDASTSATKIIDFRTYSEKLEEPNFLEPNKSFNLSINLPFVIDSVILPSSEKTIDLGSVVSIEKEKLTFEKGVVGLKKTEVTGLGETLKHNPGTNQEEIITDYSLTIPFFIKHRLPFSIEWAFGGIVLMSALAIIVLKRKGVAIVIGFLLLLVLSSIIFMPDTKFYISSTEIDALSVLKRLPKGSVLVYEKDCFNCTFQTRHRPASASGKKSYVSKYSEKNVLIDFPFQLSKTSQEARQYLKDKGVEYVYLSKYGEYIESLPYLPQDLGIERVYENANAEIYQVKN